MPAIDPAIDPTLVRAVSLSLALHTLLLAAPGASLEPAAPTQAAAPLLHLHLAAAQTAIETQPPLFLPLPLPQPPPAAPQPAPRATPSLHRAAPHYSAQAEMRAAPAPLAGEAARQASKQLAAELLYPPEAIARGLQGQALVLLFLDAAGNVIAARLEASSGHALLDDAAVRAATQLRALPASAPREALLPVRFRLH